MSNLYFLLYYKLLIRDVLDIIQKETGIDFPETTVAFYYSKTYKTLQNTENAFWAKSSG